MPSPNLVIVAGHAICTNPRDPLAESNWILLDFQRNEIPCYIGHIEAGVKTAAADPNSLLIFAGGYSRPDAGPRSEAQSYFWIADHYGWFGSPEVRDRAITEEFSRDSYENLLYSICRCKEFTGDYPGHVTFVSWEFKRARFELHRRTMGWPAERFSYLGPNNPPDVDQAIAAETRNRGAYEKDPYSSTLEFRLKRDARNPFRRTAGYLQVCPELRGLIEHEGPDWYAGPLPWEDQ
jgi:hypothetical protein